jgi:hypothetical protein
MRAQCSSLFRAIWPRGLVLISQSLTSDGLWGRSDIKLAALDGRDANNATQFAGPGSWAAPKT